MVLAKQHGLKRLIEKLDRVKKRKVNGLWLPFLYEVLGDFAAVSWADHDFPAAELFDFAAGPR